MLITSSTISVAISSSIVFTFTSLLFLSGYVLQQQTIRSLQSAIRPPAAPAAVPSTSPVLAKHFGRPPGHSFYDKYLARHRPRGGWAKAAYVALVREDVHVCNAVMGFKALAQGESMAQRVLMYPSAWDREGDGEGGGGGAGAGGGSRETSRRLLRAAAKQYKVMLQPVRPVPASTIPSSKEGEGEAPAAQWSPEEQYPLTNLLSLLTFNRIIYLPPSGLLMDVSPLDLLFTLPMEEEKDEQQPHAGGGGTAKMLGLSDPLSRTNDAAVLLIEPSKKLYADTLASLPEGAYADDEFFARVKTHVAPSSSSSSSTHDDTDTKKPDASSSSSSSGVAMVIETSSLRDGIVTTATDDEKRDSNSSSNNKFNATRLLAETAYARLRDDGLRGPEYDLPPAGPRRDGVWPRDGEARRAWRELYERYRQERMDVCGLDLEPWGGGGGGGGGGEGRGEPERGRDGGSGGPEVEVEADGGGSGELR